MLPIVLPSGLGALLEALGAPAEDVAAAESVPVMVWQVSEGAPLWHQGALAQTLCVVRTGTFKRSRLWADGYEQVMGFVGPGELIGFGGLAQGCQPFSATALEDSSVFALQWQELERLRISRPALDRALMRAASESQLRATEVACLMSAVGSEVRLARFLVQESDRRAARGQACDHLYLRMCRRDLASLLGLAHETASRSFGALARDGLVRVHDRHIEIVDLERLRELAQITRTSADFAHEAGHPAPRPVARPTHDLDRVWAHRRE